MIGTYAAAIFVIAASISVGGAALWLAGRHEWSWIAPVVGLATITVAAWLLVRLPGEGTTALVGIGVLALICSTALPSIDFGSEHLREGAATGLIALIAVSIPFAIEGHFGILGTGFNVDMSQHLYVAAGIADPDRTPQLIRDGYPVGPHALAVAGSKLSGNNLVAGFNGVTIAVPVLLAMTALAGTRDLGPKRGVVAAALVALPFLVASYFAQGAFKELFEAAFLIGFALWLRELSHGRGPADGRGFAVPGALLVAGALYAYSGPGLAWLGGTLGVWALIALLRERGEAVGRLRPALAGLGVAAVLLVVLVAPEASRIVNFGGSAGNVANVIETSSEAQPVVLASARDGWPPGWTGYGPKIEQDDAGTAAGDQQPDLFDNQLATLFGDIPALEMLGVWPSGDFRVKPGDGSVPAPLFYLAALLGLAALLVGLRRALAEHEDALLAAFIAAFGIWLAALLLSTPYTTAKALQMLAPVLMLISLRGVLVANFAPLRPRPRLGTALAAAFVLAAAGSSALALAKAPVGPSRYTTAVAKLRPKLAGEPVLLLAPALQIADEHAAEYYGWELRGADPICVAPLPESGVIGGPAPPGIAYVVTTGAASEPPFGDAHKIRSEDRIELWRIGESGAPAAPIRFDPDHPTSCELDLSGP
jgi:hypothetical protein